MGVQNSLDRIFQGMAAQLRDVIAPNLADPFARSQALAMVELLGNLETRVEWRCEQLRQVVDGVREVLGDRVPDTAGMSNRELLEARREALAALAQAQAEARSVEDRRRLTELAGRLLDAELGRVRTGMYRRSR